MEPPSKHAHSVAGAPPGAAHFDDNEHDGRQARLVLASSGGLAILSLIFSLLGVLTSLPTLTRDCALAAVALAGAAIMARHRPRRAAILTVAVLYVMFIKFIYDYDGLESSALMWLVVLPLLSAHTLSPRAGLVMAAAVACGSLGLLWLTRAGYRFPAPLTQEVNQLFRSASAAGIAVFLASVGWFTERERVAGARSLRTINQALALENTRRQAAERDLQIEIRVAQLSSRATGLLDAAPDLAHLLCDGLGFDWAIVWIARDDALSMAGMHGTGAGLTAEIDAMFDEHHRRGDGFAGSAWDAGVSLSVVDINTGTPSDRDGSWRAAFARLSAVSGIAAPFSIAGEVYAVITLFSSQRRPDVAQELEVLDTLRSAIDMLFHRERMGQARRDLDRQILETRRVETLARLAAGAAHEINTPLQFISDNLAYLEKSGERSMAILGEVRGLIAKVRAGVVDGAILDTLETALTRARLDQMMIQVPRAAASAREGAADIARIVDEMKKFDEHSAEDAVDLHVNR